MLPFAYRPAHLAAIFLVHEQDRCEPQVIHGNVCKQDIYEHQVLSSLLLQHIVQFPLPVLFFVCCFSICQDTREILAHKSIPM